MEKVTCVEWTETARSALQAVYDFHAENSESAAEKIVIDILKTADSIVFSEQYQIDDINPKYRRMIVRDYKILYRIHGSRISIMNVVSCKDDPRILKDL